MANGLWRFLFHRDFPMGGISVFSSGEESPPLPNERVSPLPKESLPIAERVPPHCRKSSSPLPNE